MSDLQKQAAYYEDLLAKHGENYKALDWNSTESQKLRYKILKEIFLYSKKASNLSMLDVGCGFGDLYGYFKAEGLLNRHRISYTGYDISSRLIEVAKKRYPGAKFEVKDILKDRYVPKFDYVFCSGIFNIRTTEKAEHLDFVKEMIFRFFDLAACGVGINFLSEGALPKSEVEDINEGRYYYFKPEEIVNFCRFVCGRFIVRHDYHPGDFSLFLYK